MHFEAETFRLQGDDCPQLAANRISKSDMRDDAFTKKRPFGATAGPVEKLGGQDDVSRMILLLQASNGSDTDYPANVKRAQGEDVGTMVQLGRQEPVPAR